MTPLALAPLVGPLSGPPLLVAVVLALLVAVLLGRVLLGVAWKLLLLALVVVVGLWALSTLQTVLFAV
jgi:hypothetical protein